MIKVVRVPRPRHAMSTPTRWHRTPARASPRRCGGQFVEQGIDLCLGSRIVMVAAVRQRDSGVAGVAQQPEVGRVGAVAVDVVDLVAGPSQSTQRPP